MTARLSIGRFDAEVVSALRSALNSTPETLLYFYLEPCDRGDAVGSERAFWK